MKCANCKLVENGKCPLTLLQVNGDTNCILPDKEYGNMIQMLEKVEKSLKKHLTNSKRYDIIYL
jgi:hypothetical protein